MKRQKLTIKEQIENMKQKGVKFEIVSEKDAATYLSKKNYYFKTKSYARNYDIYTSTENKGKYINLDFAYLQELSTLDILFRKLIMNLALDVEHFLKVKMMSDLTSLPNDEEDGYELIEDYLQGAETLRSIHKKMDSSTCSSLILKRQEENDEYALWEIVEVLSFGSFIDIYDIFYSKHKCFKNHIGLLWPIKIIRNAAAHSNCLLNTIKHPYKNDFKYSRSIMTILSQKSNLSKESRETWMKNPLIHDFIVLVYVFLSVVEDPDTKMSSISNIKNIFIDRMKLHKDFFEKNRSITNAYIFCEKAISFLINKYGRK